LSFLEQSSVQIPCTSQHTNATSLAAMRIRLISSHDTARHSEYQRLRTAIFVQQYGWELPVDDEGRERDQYDQQEDSSIRIYGVYGVHETIEYLLGGVRVFSLRTWENSMLFNEFRLRKMIPDAVLTNLETLQECSVLLELTRLCVQRSRWYTPPGVSTHFPCVVARDLTYAAVYQVAAQTNRWKALALVSAAYFQVMRRSQFVFQELYTHNLHVKAGYALTIIDLKATIQAICEVGEFARAERMMTLCSPAS
jgi:N-acyl-L-homoserine lactone synthetase